MQGDGIVLGSLPLLQDEVQRGTLTALPGPGLTTGKGYYLTMPQGSVASDNAARLWEYLAG